MQQVELDVPAAADLLPGALRLAVGQAASPLRDGQPRGEEGGREVLGEGELSLRVAAHVLEEDPAHPARLAAVREVEVAVAALLEARVVRGIVAVASGAQHPVEVRHVLFEEVVGREVGPAAEPGLPPLDDVPDVGVGGRHERAARVQDEREPDRCEGASLTGQPAREGLRELAVHVREGDAGFFQHRAVLQDAGDPAPAAGPNPGVAPEARHAIEPLQGGTDLFLQRGEVPGEVGADAVRERGKGHPWRLTPGLRSRLAGATRRRSAP